MRGTMRRYLPFLPLRLSPRLTDWSLALAVGLAFATGLVSLISGRVELWLVFALHGAAGLWLLLLLEGKLRRVWPRVIHPRRWDWRMALGLLATLVVVLAGVTGVWWVAGGNLDVAGFNLLNWHIVLGFALTLLVALHMVARFRPLRVRDVRGRRQALRFGALTLGAAALWPAQQVLQRAFVLPGASRRFTGSREAGSFAGNAFPTSSWVADAPRPIDPATWRLTIGGAVATPLTLSYADLVPSNGQSGSLDTLDSLDTLEATLDCTGGFYSTQRWHGATVGRLLERADPHPDGRYVSFISVTSYRWSLPLEAARCALLATHVGDEPLSYDHGAPARLVASGRRGFEWVKWVVRIEVRTEPDFGEILAIHTSSLTPEGRGER
jgi:DMSO/TMAO reductase YedYZ molybdopterin-dependent catalytic subunit